MSMGLTTILMFAVLIVLLTTGLPVVFVIGSISIVFAFFLWGTGGLSMMIYPTYGLMNVFILSAIPLFIFMGLILQKSGIADEMFEAIYKWSGGLRGGAGCGDGGLSVPSSLPWWEYPGQPPLPWDSSPCRPCLSATIPSTWQRGTIQAGGALGLLIPPSIPFLVYAFVARESAAKLFASGLFPGLILAAMYIVYILVRAYIQPGLAPALAVEERVSFREKLICLKALILPMFIIFSVIGCVIFGITTIIEASVIGAIGAMIAAATRRKLTWTMIRESLHKSASVTAMVMWIALAAVCFGAIYTGLGASDLVQAALESMGLGKWGVLIFMQISFFFLGMFLDDTAIMFLTIPLYLPIVKGFGFDPIWFGTLFVINMQMAFITPPYGLNLFYMKGVVPPGISMADLYWSVIPFIIIQALGLAIVMMFPEIALWLPRVLFKA